MREAIGGALLYYIIIPIFIIFIVFIGFIMRYASAYRAANYIVTQIESCQGYGNCASNWNCGDLSNKYHYKGGVTVQCSQVSGSSSSFSFRLVSDFYLSVTSVIASPEQALGC